MNPTELETEPIDELLSAECLSVSGRSTLTYTVGRHQANQTLHLRIADNTGKGIWCKDWARAEVIEAIVIGKLELTAKSFYGVHPGRSINTAGFVLAALRDLGLIRPTETNTRLHEHVPMTTLEQVVMARMKGEVPKARRKAKELA